MVTAGVGGYYSGTYNLESLAGKTIAGCAAGELSGSGCQKGAAYAFGTAALALGWNYTKDMTDKLKLLECTETKTCAYDERGMLRTDGARTTDWAKNPERQGNWLTDSGMADEGNPHIYDNTPWLRNFIVDVSKTHDWFNSWNYNGETGRYVSQGIWGDSLFQIYSFTGMPIAGALTGLSYLDRYPALPYLLPPKKDGVHP